MTPKQFASRSLPIGGALGETRNFSFILFLITSLGLALRLDGLLNQRLWWDEAALYLSAVSGLRDSLDGPVAIISTQLMMKYFSTKTSLYLLPALFGTAAIPVAGIIGRTLVGPLFGVSFSLAIAIHHLPLSLSRQARTYGYLIFFLLLSVLLAIHVFRNPRTKGMFVCTVAIALGCMTHLKAIEFFGCLWLGYLVFRFKYFLQQGKVLLDRRDRFFLFLVPLVILLSSLWSLDEMGYLRRGFHFKLNSLSRLFWTFAQGAAFSTGHYSPLDGSDCFFFAYSLFFAAVGYKYLRRELSPLVSATLASCILLVLSFNLFHGLNARIAEKYLIAAILCFLFLVSAGYARLLSLKSNRWIIPILLLVPFFPGHLTRIYKNNYDYLSLKELVRPLKRFPLTQRGIVFDSPRTAAIYVLEGLSLKVPIFVMRGEYAQPFSIRRYAADPRLQNPKAFQKPMNGWFPTVKLRAKRGFTGVNCKPQRVPGLKNIHLCYFKNGKISEIPQNENQRGRTRLSRLR